jgi:hypothetical protein
MAASWDEIAAALDRKAGRTRDIITAEYIRTKGRAYAELAAEVRELAGVKS